MFHDVSERTGPVLMTNHFLNVQCARLYEVKAARVPVTGPDTFPHTELGWPQLAINSPFLR